MTRHVGSGSNPCTLALAVLAGVAIGAVAMALTTPRTGRDLRAILGRALRRRGPGADGAWDPEDPEAMFI